MGAKKTLDLLAGPVVFKLRRGNVSQVGQMHRRNIRAVQSALDFSIRSRTPFIALRLRWTDSLASRNVKSQCQLFRLHGF